MQQRNVTVDILKAFCIVLVVVGHFNPDNAPESYKSLVTIIYSFHMPAFMWASGFLYVLTMKEMPYFSFVGKKLKRLMLPYIIVSIIILGIKLLSQRHLYVENPVTTQSFLKILYQPEAGYFLWFLWALMLMFLITPFFKTWKSRVALFTISSIISFLEFDITSLFCLDSFITFLPYFSLGMCSADIYRKYGTLLHKNSSVSFSILLTFISLIVFVALRVTLPDIGNLDNYIIAVSGIMWIVCFSEMITVSCKRLAWLLIIADASFIIYLFHTTFQGFAKAIIQKFPVSEVFIINLLVMVIIGCIGPILLDKFVLKKFAMTRFCFSTYSKKLKTERLKSQSNN